MPNASPATLLSRRFPSKRAFITGAASGYLHSLVLCSDGTLAAWGYNVHGQLGNGGQSDVNPSPLDVSGMSTATQMTAGYDHTCARLGDGSAKCWGGIRLGNGDGTVSTSKVPVSINTSPGIPLQGVLQISAGTGHTCAIVTGNTAKCWGDNLYGQLGNGGTASFPEYPVDVVGLNGVPLADVVKLSAGRAYTCAITAGAFGNRVKCWGYSGNGQLGDGRTGLHGEPATVLLAPNAGVTTTTLSASPGASSYGQPVTLTATVHNGNAPTGFVEFSANDFYIAGCESVALTGGQAQCVTSALPIGTNTLKATYGGDTGNAASSGEKGRSHAGHTRADHQQLTVDGLECAIDMLSLALCGHESSPRSFPSTRRFEYF